LEPIPEEDAAVSGLSGSGNNSGAVYTKKLEQMRNANAAAR
jgi:hypothetical protein